MQEKNQSCNVVDYGSEVCSPLRAKHSATERLLCGSGSHFLQDLDHYEQFIDYEHFGRFDYGTMGNLEHYGLELPPEYSLSELEIPTALFCGSKDTLAGPKDVERLKMDLKGNKHVVFSKEYEARPGEAARYMRLNAQMQFPRLL